jgi:hypothetical protein
VQQQWDPYSGQAEAHQQEVELIASLAVWPVVGALQRAVREVKKLRPRDEEKLLLLLVLLLARFLEHPQYTTTTLAFPALKPPMQETASLGIPPLAKKKNSLSLSLSPFAALTTAVTFLVLLTPHQSLSSLLQSLLGSEQNPRNNKRRTRGST